MTPTPGILYNIGDIIVCAEREKPINDGSSYYYDRSIYFEDMDSYELALKSWEESCKDVVNYYQMGENLFRIELTETQLSPCIEHGQKCLKVPEGDKVRVVKLL